VAPKAGSISTSHKQLDLKTFLEKQENRHIYKLSMMHKTKIELVNSMQEKVKNKVILQITLLKTNLKDSRRVIFFLLNKSC
jgi:hypothetical protein